MHGPAVYLISVLLFLLAGMLLFAAGSSWAKIAQHRDDDEPISRASFRAAAGLTSAALVLLGAAVLWAALLVLVVQV
jgi:hypothetical protein